MVTVQLRALGTLGISSPSIQSWAGFFSQGGATSCQTQPSSLPSPPSCTFPLIRCQTSSLTGCACPLGYVRTLAQEGSVTQRGSSVRPSRAGACLDLHFTSHFANLSPHSLSLHALRWSRPGAFPGQHIPSPARSRHCGQQASSDPVLMSKLGLGRSCLRAPEAPLVGGRGACGPTFEFLGLMARGWICWE